MPATVNLPAHADVQALLDDACRHHRVPGAVLGIGVGADAVVVAHGVRNVATGEPMTADTVAQIASVSKLFTAAVLHGLLDEHGISVDTAVCELLPELASLDAGVSVRRLLDHTSGLQGDLWDDFGANADAVARFTAAIPGIGSISAPGELLSYCNSGYVALGRLVEVLGSGSFDRVVDRRLLGPLGLAHTTLRLTDAVRHRMAMGHDLADDGTLKVSPFISMRCLGPTGGVLSTVPDLLRVARALPASMSTRSSRNPEPWTVGPGWCLGMTDCTGGDGVPVVGHDGLWIGNGAYVRVIPGRDVVVAMTGAAGHARAAWQDVWGHLAGWLGLQPVPPVPVDAAWVPDPVRYEGTYHRLSQTITVEYRDGTLSMTSTPTGPIAAISAPTSVVLTPRSPDVFVARAGSGVDLPVVFLGEGRRAAYLHTGMRVARRDVP